MYNIFYQTKDKIANDTYVIGIAKFNNLTKIHFLISII